MKSVFILHHSYERDDLEETKLIGAYSSQAEAEAAIGRLKEKPGFKDHPCDFIINEYKLNEDGWSEGFSTMTTIMVKDTLDNWKAVSAAIKPNGIYEIVEKYENDSLGEFKDGDFVRCEAKDDVLYAVEKSHLNCCSVPARD